MTLGSVNRIRGLREGCGLTQLALAEAVGLSRQSMNAIEGGRAMPRVDVAMRIAAVLGASVEELFGGEAAGQLLMADMVSGTSGNMRNPRVALAEIAGRWQAYPLEQHAAHRGADGLVDDFLEGGLQGVQVAVRPLRELESARENIVLMGCAAALGLLADQLNVRLGAGRFMWLQNSSLGALKAVIDERTHIAGVHFVDPKTGEANTVDVRRHAGDRPFALVTLARWQTGFVVARGNPLGLREASDLSRAGLRVVTREAGASTQRLLEQIWAAAGHEGVPPRQRHFVVRGHFEVAHAVAMGAADTGVASLDAALAYDLDFVPLADERYDLVVPLPLLADARVERLLDVMSSAAFRSEIGAFGYDSGPTGNRVAYEPAA